MGLHFFANNNAIFRQWALRGRLPSSCCIFEPQTWEGRRQGNLDLLTLKGDITPIGGVRDGSKEASVCCWEDSVPCHPFRSLNEVSSERGQWETSGETSSPKSTHSCLFPGRAPLQVWLPRPGPEYARTSECSTHWQ